MFLTSGQDYMKKLLINILAFSFEETLKATHTQDSDVSKWDT